MEKIIKLSHRDDTKTSNPKETQDKVAANREIKDINGNRECVICCDALSSTIIAPCRHICCCDRCGMSGELQLCPICRGPIISIEKVFFS